MGSMINPPVINEAFVRNIPMQTSTGATFRPYQAFPGGPINGLNPDGTPTPQLQVLKAGAVLNGIFKQPMNDYYKGWEVDNQVVKSWERSFLKILPTI
jgi:hypothetical protein